MASNISGHVVPHQASAFEHTSLTIRVVEGLTEDYPYESKRHNSRNARAGVVGMGSYESKRVTAPTELLVSLNAIRGRNGQDQLKILLHEGQNGQKEIS